MARGRQIGAIGSLFTPFGLDHSGIGDVEGPGGAQIISRLWSLPVFTEYNNLTVEIYSSGVTRIADPLNLVGRATDISFGTFYPGGIYGAASLFIPHPDITDYRPFKLSQRIVFRNGQSIVYEGEIAAIQPDAGARPGWHIECAGLWGRLTRRMWNHRFADNRLDDTLWRVVTSVGSPDKFDSDRSNRIRVVPRDGIRLSAQDFQRITYTMPTGETIKRIKLNYDFSETGLLPATGVRQLVPGVPDTWPAMPNVFDDDDTTSETFTYVAGSNYLYVGSNHPDAFDFIRVNLGATVNANASVLSVYYHDGTSWIAVSNLVDGTASGGATFAQDGDITFDKPGDWDAETLIDDRMYWIEISASASWTASVVLNEIRVGQRQIYEWRLRDTVGAANIWSITATGAAARDDTLATERQALSLDLLSSTPQLGIGNGSIRGQITSVMVYALRPDGTFYSSGTPVTLPRIVADVQDKFTDLINTTEVYIATPASPLTLEPFISNGYESAADLLTRASRYGDAAYNAWAVYFDHSERAVTKNGLPVIACEQIPALTDYDYAIRLDEFESGATFSLIENASDIYNWIIVHYTDELTNVETFITPDDDATLKDQTSIDTYGQRELQIDTGTANATTAANIGRRTLASKKDMHYIASGPLVKRDSIRTKAGDVVPVSQVRAGQRIKIEDFITNVEGTGLTSLITATRYTDASGGSVSITCGSSPDDLPLWLAQRELG